MTISNHRAMIRLDREFIEKRSEQEWGDLMKRFVILKVEFDHLSDTFIYTITSPFLPDTTPGSIPPLITLEKADGGEWGYLWDKQLRSI